MEREDNYEITDNERAQVQAYAPAPALHHAPIDHIAGAFLAAKNGDHEFLEVLLGPSIPAEIRKVKALCVRTQQLHEIQIMWEFRQRLMEAKLVILKKFRSGVDNIEVLNHQLDQCADSVVDSSVKSWLDRCEVHAIACYHPDHLLFPMLDHLDEASPQTMKDFFAKWEGVKLDEHGIYSINVLIEENKVRLVQLQVDRYLKQVESTNFVIRNIRDINANIGFLVTDIENAATDIENVSDQKTKGTYEMLVLNEHLYPARQKRFDDLVAKFQNTPPKGIPLIYHRSLAQQLPQLLKSAKVSMDAVDEEGNTLMHVAAKAGRFNVVQLLLNRCADLNKRNNAGATAYDLAQVDEMELKRLAKFHNKRPESKFLTGVNEAYLSYKQAHEHILNSFKKYFHSKKMLEERTQQIIDVGASLDQAEQSSTDESLMECIRAKNRDANRGRLGRSKFFDPLMDQVKLFLEEEGYGIRKGDITEVFNGVDLVAINAELTLAYQKQEAQIRELNEELKEQRKNNEAKSAQDNSVIVRLKAENVEKSEVIRSYQSKVEEHEALLRDTQLDIVKNKESAERETRASEKKISDLEKRMDILMELMTRQQHFASPAVSVPELTQQTPIRTGSPVTLFRATSPVSRTTSPDTAEFSFISPGSARFPRVPLENLNEEGKSTVNNGLKR